MRIATARLMATVGCTALMVMATHASAQDSSPTEQPRPATEVAADPPGGDDGEIIVTGTLIRGIAPTGTNVVTMSRQDIIATGAASANEILTRIPQVTSAFLGTPTTPSGDSGLSVVRPNIRELGASGTSTTLVLVDGHRLVGAGVLQTTADPDVIPPGVLERVEVVPDGGSSIYGSDAIGGVINYITRRSFDGFEAAGRYGFADDYQSRDLNLTAGKAWDTGSAYLSYAFASNDEILGRDRDFMRQVSPNAGYCAPGTISANGTTYALPGRAAGTITNCDNLDNQSFWPETRRHAVFARFNQDLNESLNVDVKGYYSRRQIDHSRDFAAISPQNFVVTNANPFFRPIGTETQQTVLTTFAGVFDDRLRNRLTSFGVTPTVAAQLGGGWQLRLLGNYGASTTMVTSVAPDGGAVASALASSNSATALNPYDPAASSPAAIASIVRKGFAEVDQKLLNSRLVADGALFALPGGEVRIAAGAEYIKEKYSGRNGQAVFGQEDLLPVTKIGRDVKAVFAEVVVPIVGSENSMGGIHSLTLSASGRYDDYSDVGETFNPKIGVTFEPMDWIKIRGNWGESFNAPSLLDRSGNQAIGGLPVPFISGQQAPWSVILAGNDGSNTPQTATTWSLGADIRPPIIPELTLSATYYNIHLTDVIGLLFGQQNLSFTPATSDFLMDNVPCTSLLPQYGSVNPFLVPLSTVCALSPTVALLDFRVQNLGTIKQDGIDFLLTYKRDVGFGSVRASFAGTYTLNRDVAIITGAPFVEELESPGNSRFGFSASLGAQVGALSASTTLNHRAGYELNPAVVSPRFGTQNSVDSFTTVDLFFELGLPFLLDAQTSLTFNVTNLFDQDPPFFAGCVRTTACGYTNGSTLGRQAQVGIRTKF